jgi:uncharacterized protein (DUF58 family)
MHIVLLVDATSSMNFEDKFLRAKQLAAAMGLLGLLNVERVSAYAFSDESRPLEILPPCSGRGSLLRLMAIILSDFLTFGELQKPFNMLFSAGLDVFGVQILGPTERNPEVAGDLRFVDSETAHTLDISSAGELLGLYHEHREALEEELGSYCRQRSGRFVSIGSRDPLDWVLFDLLRRQGWVR